MKKFKKINVPMLMVALALTSCVCVLPGIENVSIIVSLIICLLWVGMAIGIAVLPFSEQKFYERMERFSKKLNARCWIKIADSPFPQIYMFDLDNAHIYGVFALNPFSIQKINLIHVKDVDIIYNAHRLIPLKQWTINLSQMEDVEIKLGSNHSAINSGIVCNIYFEEGKVSICLWHDRKYHHLWVGQVEELRERENALKLKKLILDLRNRAAVLNRTTARV